MESCSSSVATDQTDRCSNFSVISSLSQVFPHSLDHQSIPTNHLTQLHELSTMNGTEEDLSSILKREEVDLPGLHGAVNETTRRSRRPGRVRPRIRLKTEQVRRCYQTSFHNSFQPTEKPGRERPDTSRENFERSGLARRDDHPVEKKGTLPHQVVEGKNRRSLFYHFDFREASNLESEVIGLKENMKTVLEDNLNLKTELLRWRSQREAESKHVDTTTQPGDKRQLDLLEVQVNEYKERSSAHASQLEEKNKQLEEQERRAIQEKAEKSRLQAEKDRWRAEAEELRIGTKTIQQVGNTILLFSSRCTCRH